MKRLVPLVASLLVLPLVSTVSSAEGWYIHRTSEQMSEPPWYCYCYRLTEDNVITGVPTHPIEMQIPYELALEKMASLTTQSDACETNCGFGSIGIAVTDPDASPEPGGSPPGSFDLSGHWRSEINNQVMEFVSVGDGKVAPADRNKPLSMWLLPDGRVRLEWRREDEEPLIVDGDIVEDGSDQRLVFDEIPGLSQRLILHRT